MSTQIRQASGPPSCSLSWLERDPKSGSSTPDVIIWELYENRRSSWPRQKDDMASPPNVYKLSSQMLNGKHPIWQIFIWIIQSYKLLTDFVDWVARDTFFFSEALDPSFWGTYRIKEKMHYLILLLQAVSYMVELELGLTPRQQSILRTYLITTVNLLSCRLALNKIKRSLKRKKYRPHKKSEMVVCLLLT